MEIRDLFGMQAEALQLRERFGIEAKNSATASRLIKEALEAGMIRLYDKGAARKLMKYVPIWA